MERPLSFMNRAECVMDIIATGIPDLVVVKIAFHSDHRGFFAETWRESWSQALHIETPFVQDNHARSEEAGVLRGLHFQRPPAAQSKLVWVTRGAVYDVAVDLRKGSPTYGQWHGLVLSGENRLRFFVPRGFAHGYMTLEPGTEFHYKVDNYYSAEHEGGIAWNAPELAVPWPDIKPVLSAKDTTLPSLTGFDSPFVYSGKESTGRHR